MEFEMSWIKLKSSILLKNSGHLAKGNQLIIQLTQQILQLQDYCVKKQDIGDLGSWKNKMR